MTESSSQNRELIELIETIRQQYDIQVTGVVQLKTVYGMMAADGRRFIWKRIADPKSAERLQGIMPVLDYLTKHGISHGGPIRNSDGSPIVHLHDGRLGTLQPWIVGQHVDYRDPDQRYQSIATVARMHRISRPLADHPRPLLLPGGPLLHKLDQKRKSLHQLWAEAKHHCLELRTVESDVMTGCERAYQAVRQVGMITDASSCTFCHRDLAPHNLIIAPDRTSVSLIDFDLSGFDDPFLDVMQMMNHLIFTGTVRPGDLYHHVTRYFQSYPSPEYRMLTLWDLIRFPDVLLRTLVEWAKVDFKSSLQTRIRAAIQREQMRVHTWRLDYMRWRQGQWRSRSSTG